MNLIDKVKIIDIDKLYPYTNNPKEHPPEQINKIASSIKNFGYMEIVKAVIKKLNLLKRMESRCFL